jgi:hypothetical protein
VTNCDIGEAAGTCSSADPGVRLARVRHLVTIETNGQVRAQRQLELYFICRDRNLHYTHNKLILRDNI